MTDLRELVLMHYDGLNTGNVDLAVRPFSDDVAGEFPTGPTAGLAQLRATVGAFITAFPDMVVTTRNIWLDGDTAIAEMNFHGTQTGPMATPDGELAPTGREVAFPLIDIFTLRDGRVAEHRVFWDNASFLAQLGLLPA